MVSSPGRVGPRLLATAAVVAGLWLRAAPAAAACLGPAPGGQLVVTMEDAEAAYGQLDLGAFQAAMDEGASMIPCLDGLLGRGEVARYDRLAGLQAWLGRTQERSEAAFLAARLIEPGYRFPTTLVPEDHPTRQAYAALPVESVLRSPVEVPAGGHLVVDGREAQERPTNVPSLVQLQRTGPAPCAGRATCGPERRCRTGRLTCFRRVGQSTPGACRCWRRRPALPSCPAPCTGSQP